MKKPPDDEIGYPSAATLRWIKTVEATTWEQLHVWFAEILRVWQYCEPDKWVRDEHDEDANEITVYELHTYGWSGNESIIAAMRRNYLAWGRTWKSSHRGGHYDFEIRGRRTTA